ncbi:hypothetical protein [Lampropedia aestuarii]|uniref:hypothetical protein n=1 Tax=Lampropedia aestuarii TaxID=2562762 RepID=UPI001F10E984|nr:hypothetical protein [Lampropedia aestuarii]
MRLEAARDISASEKNALAAIKTKIIIKLCAAVIGALGIAQGGKLVCQQCCQYFSDAKKKNIT